MQPLVKQHLESLRLTLMQVVIPELSASPFAAEQAGLIAASLALLAEVQPYEDDYLRLELSELHAALEIVGAPVEAPLPVHRDELVTRVHELKLQLSLQLDRLAQDNRGTLPAALRTRLAPLIDRQMAREASWCRLTGFVPDGTSLPAIGSLLATQREA